MLKATLQGVTPAKVIVMKKIKMSEDVNGSELLKGDIVATLSGNLTAKICDVAEDGGTHFVCLRAVQHPFSKGVWHPSDQVQRIKAAKRLPAT